jgi:asparagine synthase (glutamine-hydrolysing)
MCGIFGAIKFRGQFKGEDFERFVHLTDMVSYRGPDDSGYQAFDKGGAALANPAEGFRLFFGHRRLSIIDLSQAGHQPFVDDSGLWIVFNGEIFNYLELREELRAKGYTFRSNSDTEVILKVYREYREQGFDQLNGMWSFAIFDPARKAVILSRDRFSIKPLYFTETDDALYFGSEIKQLLPLVRRKTANEGAMYTFLEQGISDHNRETFFEGIFKVEPKTNLVIDAQTGKSATEKYWDYELEDIPDTAGGMEKFRELFLDSIKIRLRSDVRVGSLLSGGLDSSSITVFADRLQGGNFHSFSVVSRNRKYSEERLIQSCTLSPRGSSKASTRSSTITTSPLAA